MSLVERTRSDRLSSLAGRLPRRPPEWLWWLSIGGQVASAMLLTSFAFFWLDDFLLLGQARLQRFGVGYLREALFGHFSPDLRALDSLLVAIAPGSWILARVVAMAIYAATILAAMFALRAIMGRTWGALALATLFGQSIFMLQLLGWWSAEAAILPNSLFMFLALGCALRWFDRRRTRWLIGTLVAFFLALCDYELAMVFPAYLLLARLLVMEDDLAPRRLVAVLWRERWLWIGLAVLDALTLANFFAFYYYKSTAPTLGQVLAFLWDSAGEAFVPALLGYSRTPAQPGTVTLVVTLAIFVAGLLVTCLVHPRAPRALLALVVAFVLAMLPIGLNRIGQAGVTTGEPPLYQASAAFVFVMFAGFMLSGRWGRSPRTRRRNLPVGGRWVAGVAAVGGLAVAAYAVSYLSTARHLKQVTQYPQVTQRFVERYIRSADVIRARTGVKPAVIDRNIPTTIMPTVYYFYNEARIFLGLFASRAQFNRWTTPLYGVSDDGTLRPATLRRLAVGRIASTQVVGSAPTEAAVSPSIACVHGIDGSALRIPLVAQAHPGLRGSSTQTLGFAYRSASRFAATVFAVWRNGAVADLGSEELTPGDGRILFPIRVGAPPGSPVAAQIQLAPGICVTRAELMSVTLSR